MCIGKSTLRASRFVASIAGTLVLESKISSEIPNFRVSRKLSQLFTLTTRGSSAANIQICCRACLGNFATAPKPSIRNRHRKPRSSIATQMSFRDALRLRSRCDRRVSLVGSNISCFQFCHISLDATSPWFEVQFTLYFYPYFTSMSLYKWASNVYVSPKRHQTRGIFCTKRHMRHYISPPCNHNFSICATSSFFSSSCMDAVSISFFGFSIPTLTFSVQPSNVFRLKMLR